MPGCSSDFPYVRFRVRVLGPTGGAGVVRVNRERAHIPPITTNESNPFPYQVLVVGSAGGSGGSLGGKMGIF